MVAAVILLAVSLAGNALAPVPFTTISQSEQSSVEEARQVAVRTPAVFLGSRNTAGYRVTITGIEHDGAVVSVTYREERPAARDILAQVITFPHHLVRVDRIAGEVKFARAD